MDIVVRKVSLLITGFKKATLPVYYNFIQSTRGHGCMRKVGPVVMVLFYATQLLHAFLFYTVFMPCLDQKFAEYEPFPTLMKILGWFFCYRVTYLYYRVTTSSPGYAEEEHRLHAKEQTPNHAIPLDKDLENIYSRDIAELLRYS